MSRQVLGEISGNRRKGRELSAGIRGEIVGTRKSGLSLIDIAEEYNINLSTVVRTVKLVDIRNNY